ncbi:hypothetical protein MNB_SM-4-1238 [hydrothermal vent metagenome]|uniref:Uncharacterized protein n=1 Tax=hydrothermal vent metagenome TaxID=652676 RepID=A0A1W1CM05_9ZZZZ
MFKGLFTRVKSQKGMSGVLVAMLLVLLGVGIVAGFSTFITGKTATIQTAAGVAIDKATTNSTTK